MKTEGIVYVLIDEDTSYGTTVSVYGTEEAAQKAWLNLFCLDDKDMDDEKIEEINEMMEKDKPVAEIYERAKAAYEESREDGCAKSWYYYEEQAVC